MNLRLLAFQAIATPTHCSGLSLLHAFCIEGDFETVRLILTCSPGRLDNAIALSIKTACCETEHAGKTPVEVAKACCSDLSPHSRILELLQDVTKPFRCVFYVAIKNGTYDHVTWLLKLGANVNEVRCLHWLLSHHVMNKSSWLDDLFSCSS